MSAIKPIIRELKQAALKGFAHADHKLHQLTANMDGHLDTVIREVRDRDNYDGKVDVSLKKFKKNKKHDSDEYNRQYDEQMDTLQKMPLSDWLKNRIEYLENGRTSDSLRAQQDARDNALKDKINELLDADDDLDYDDAKDLASEWLKGQAATHRLDGIAGGDVTDISGVGDTRINSSLGSQWRSRVGDIDAAVIDFLNANPGVDLDNTFINVVLR
ncbi:polymorphic toxin type 15 domain-containing protein [Microbacterium sp. CIAB417]|uniref:polymorphic toxin type 15 domain-containing protein n=1 Tax=Microbacterium sp. CIAB417 TaxID=2860287 RepID=UPI001FAD2C26|nr:polymorphic toxin type 15 domain-containing protein [Microbacterium sp. CIAB417]